MTALIVGGLTGIGAAAASLFGDDAVVWSRRAGGVDACDPGSVAAALAAFEKAHGAPDVLVHAVGDFAEVAALDADLRHYRHMVDSNLTSAFVVCRAVLPRMVAAGRGRVLLFAAAGVENRQAMVRAPLYFAAKAALVSLARSLALEAAAGGVTVNVLSPGIVRHASSHRQSQDRLASKVPLGRAGDVADLAGAMRLLLSDDGAYITGAELTVDGGLSLRGGS